MTEGAAVVAKFLDFSTDAISEGRLWVRLQSSPYCGENGGVAPIPATRVIRSCAA